MPGAKTYLTLSIIQDWTVKYNSGENIGLVPQGNTKGGLGMFLLDSTGGAYDQDVVFKDGPIIYGTGMNDQDRQNAWKHFFLMMVQAADRQQGTDTVKVKLAKRCLPNEDYCTMELDANLIGIGGIQEPRKVIVVVATDKKDSNLQLVRMVCTWPTKEIKVCRYFETGKLVGDMPNYPRDQGNNVAGSTRLYSPPARVYSPPTVECWKNMPGPCRWN